MLVQMPRGSSGQAEPQNAGECNNFEAALRRDLATAPVVSYDPVVGGWTKRIVDIIIVCVSAPLWGFVVLAIAGWRKLTTPDATFVLEPRVGYGGASFNRIRFASAGGEVNEAPASPANDAHAHDAGWRALIARLPALINVLRGEMSLVGPAPLSQEVVEMSPASRRYYLSARPGLIDIEAMAEPEADPAQIYKTYARGWSLSLDVMLAWDSLRRLQRSRAVRAPVSA